MSWTLFKTTARANWPLLLVITLILMIYVPTAIAMFNPESAEDMEAMLGLMPEAMIRAMGFVDLGTDLTRYLGNYLYGFIMLAFPTIYTVMLANRLIARHVDSGSMAYLLTTPTTRVRIALTQAVYLAASLFVMILFATLIAIGLSEAMFAGHLDIGGFLALNWVTYLSLLAAAGVSFLASCGFGEARYSLAFGAGIPALFFVFRMLSQLGGSTEWMRWLTVYSFVNVDRVLSGGPFALHATLVLVPLAIALPAAGIAIFNRKSLAL